MKKCMALILTLVLMLSVGITCPAAEKTVEYLTNGDFEDVKNETTPTGWKLSGAEWGGAASLVTEDVPSGKYALKFAADEGAMYITQQIALIPSTDYTLSYKIKVMDRKSGCGMKLEFYTIDESGKRTYVDALSESIEVESKDWTDGEIQFTTGDTIMSANILFRIWNGGEYYWDALSLQGPAIPDKDPVPSENIKPAFDGTQNLIVNGGFEESDGADGAKGWESYGGAWTGNQYGSIDADYAFAGEKSAKVQTSSGGNPYVWQAVAVEPNTEYQVSAWVRQKGIGVNSRNLRFKIEFYTDMEGSSGSYMGGINSGDLTPAEENLWVQQECTFTTWENTVMIKVYCRLHASVGSVWFDDVELRQIGKVSQMFLDTDQYFYYPDLETGYAKTTLTQKFAEENRAGTMDFALLGPDKATVLKEQKGTAMTDDMAYFDYPISLLSQKKTAYWVVATLRDAAGNAVDTMEVDIYCYDRPSKLTEEGTWMEDGKAVDFTMGYHIGLENHETANNLGMNLVQIGYGGAEAYLRNKETLVKQLDDLAARGMKGVVCLYTFMKAAAHPDNIEATKAIVTDLIDHPAVFGYATMDEPFAQIPNTVYYMKESYKAIRDIDDVHPVYMLDANGTDVTEASKLCDVFVNDPYPSSKRNPGTYPGEVTALMRRATERYGKPTMIVNQAFSYGMTPTAENLRSFWYQSLFEEAGSGGWYELTGNTGILNTEEYMTFLTEFAKEEQPLSYALFGRNSVLPSFNRYENEQYAYESVVRDGDLYMLIINRAREEQTIAASLVSRNGLVMAQGAAEELYKMGGASPVVNGNTLSVTLPAGEVALVKIAGANIDPAALEAASFTDLAGYEWAAEAIEKMYREDIANRTGERTYDPASPITRGDFASFLIRALDLEVTEANVLPEDFADVPSDAPYYYEVKVGKFFGILRGVGDNSFNPEAPISRQDLMVICARGLHAAMQMGGTQADLSAFSDNAHIADYAQSAVAEMIAAGFIQGNADGTLNPLGNTTRAEAAVLMERIAAK